VFKTQVLEAKDTEDTDTDMDMDTDRSSATQQDNSVRWQTPREKENRKVAAAAAAAEEDRLKKQRQSIQASIFPKDSAVLSAEALLEEQEEAATAALASLALAAAQQEQQRQQQQRSGPDVHAIRSLLENTFIESHAMYLLSQKRGYCTGESFDLIVGEDRGEYNNHEPSSPNPAFSNSQIKGAADSLSPTKKSKNASSLKETANAQQRKRAARRRELEKDATLSFLASR
jgi:hypothetical protein